MDKRSFLKSIFGGLGAVVAAAALTPKSAEAASLFDELKTLENGAPDAADLPAEDANEAQAGGGGRGGRGRGGGGGGRAGGGRPGGGRPGGGRPGGGRPGSGFRPGRPGRRPPSRQWHRAPVRRGPRQRCWLERNRWGQLVRRCAWY